MKKILGIITLIIVTIVLCGTDILPQAQPSLEQKKQEPAPVDAASLSLNDCVKYAVYNSFQAQLAKLDLYVAETNLPYEQAVFDTILYAGLGYETDKNEQLSVFAPNDSQTNTYDIGLEKTLPTGTHVNAEFTNSRLWNNTPYVTTNPSHTSEFILSATQPVWKNAFGVNDRTKITLTRLSIQNAGLEEKDRIEALMTDVINAYWEFVFAKRSLEITKGILEKAKQLHANNAKNYEIGLIEKVDLLASESNLALRETDVLLSDNLYKRAEKNLKLVMNLDDEKNIAPSAGLATPHADLNLEDCLKASFQNRRDLQIIKRDSEIKGLDLKIKDNLRLPQLDVTATMTANGVDSKFPRAADTAFAVNYPDYFAGFEFSMPIENRKARSEYDRAKYEKEKSVVNIKDIERKIITEVGNAFRDVQSFESSLVFIRKAAKLQAEKLNEEENRFKYGRSSTKQLIDFQQDLLRAELEEAVYSLRYLKARVSLDRSMNVILPKYEASI